MYVLIWLHGNKNNVGYTYSLNRNSNKYNGHSKTNTLVKLVIGMQCMQLFLINLHVLLIILYNYIFSTGCTKFNEIFLNLSGFFYIILTLISSTFLLPFK